MSMMHVNQMNPHSDFLNYLFSDSQFEPEPLPDDSIYGEPLLNEMETNMTHQFLDYFRRDTDLLDSAHIVNDLDLSPAESLAFSHYGPHHHFANTTRSHKQNQSLDFLDLNAMERHNLFAMSAQNPNFLHMPMFGRSSNQYNDQYDFVNHPAHQQHFMGSYDAKPIATKTARRTRPPFRHRQSAPPMMPPHQKLRLSTSNLDDFVFANQQPASANTMMFPQRPTAQFGSDSAFDHACFEPGADIGTNYLNRDSALSLALGMDKRLMTSPMEMTPALTMPELSKTRPRIIKRRSSELVKAPPLVDIQDSNADAKNESPLKRRKMSDASKAAMSQNGRSISPSTQSDVKLPRQNLTEEEKKQNHIRSEQKRRNQIKEGFADLSELMPDAESDTPSKCALLARAVDWLSSMIDGNDRLEQQLRLLGGPTLAIAV